MKKMMAVALFVFALGAAAAPVFADEASAESKGFWAREAERSGLNRVSGGGFFKNLNPIPFFKNQQEKYNQRKAAAQS